MNVIAFVCQKGGPGKSTAALNLAVAAYLEHKKVLLIDLDPQATAEDWYQIREPAEPHLIKISINELPQAITNAKTAAFDYVLIDTAGRDDPAKAAAIKASNFCIVPCRPTRADIKVIPTTVATIRRLGKPYALVLTQTPPTWPRILEAQIGLESMGEVAPIPIVYRLDYQDAHGMGLGVMELSKGSKAALEISRLWRWLKQKMQEK